MSTKPTKIEKKLSTFSERVKMMDMHPREPLVICSLYSGQVTLWNYETKALVKSFEILDAPVRCVKFIVKLQSFACGADDMNIRVFNYNTMEKTKTFVAHDDYLRCIAVHDQLPIMLTSSDDMRIKAWDWTRDWACTMIFEGHQHYVMSVAFNPKDAMTFASASLDTTIKVWNLSSPEPNYSLLGHEDGVNCVEYYPGGDKPYLVTGSDDHTVKVWDYQTRACIQTLTHHVHNVTTAFFHPDVPLLFTGGEDEVVCVINTQTWRMEQSLNYGMQRAWTIAARPGTNHLAVGYDRGMVVLKAGSDEPVMTMDGNGKLYMALGSDITRFDIKNIPADTPDGEALRVASKELGTSEARPIAIAHGPSGQNIAVIGDNEYTVYSAIAWRAKTFGPCVSFAWGKESGSYAVLETPTTIKFYKGLKPGETVTLPEPADKLFSGPLLAVRSASAITFLDWDSVRVVRRIEARPNVVSWSDSNELVALILDSSFYILRYDAAVAAEQLDTCTDVDGIEAAFEAVDEGEEAIRQASWVGDCLCFINQSDRLNYYIGGEYTTVAVLNRGTHLIGYLPKENRLFTMDRDKNITSYLLHVSVVEYKGAIVREEFDVAEEILPRIPAASRDKVAQFLQSRGHLELALEVTTEDDHRFDLSVTLGRLDTALDIAKRIPSTTRWKQIGDLALEQGFFDVAQSAMVESGDLNGLLMLYTSTGDRDGLRKLGALALQKGKTNVAFTCCHMLSDYGACTEILLQTNRVADAAFYARTYNHDRVDDVVQKWKNSVAGLPRVRDAIADPAGFPNLFPNMQEAINKKAAVRNAAAEAERAAAEAEAQRAAAERAAAEAAVRAEAEAAARKAAAERAAIEEAANKAAAEKAAKEAAAERAAKEAEAQRAAAEAAAQQAAAERAAIEEATKKAALEAAEKREREAALKAPTPVRSTDAAPAAMTPGLFSPDQPRAPATTPTTAYRNATTTDLLATAADTPNYNTTNNLNSGNSLFSPDQPRVPDTTPVTAKKPPPTVVEVDVPNTPGHSHGGEFFSPVQPRAPATTPTTVYRKETEANAANFGGSSSSSLAAAGQSPAAAATEETPAAVRSARIEVAASAVAHVAAAAAVTAASSSSPSEQKLEYSPERTTDTAAPSVARHVDPTTSASPSPSSKKEVVDEDDIDAMFDDDFNDDDDDGAAPPAPAPQTAAASPQQNNAAAAAGAPAAVKDGFDDDGFGEDEDDWN